MRFRPARPGSTACVRGLAACSYQPRTPAAPSLRFSLELGIGLLGVAAWSSSWLVAVESRSRQGAASLEQTFTRLAGYRQNRTSPVRKSLGHIEHHRRLESSAPSAENGRA